MEYKLKYHKPGEYNADCFDCKYVVNDYRNPLTSGLQACCGIDVEWHDMGYSCPRFADGGYYTIDALPTDEEVEERLREQETEIIRIRQGKN